MTLTSHYTKASGSEAKKRKVRDAKVCNTNLNSPQRDDVGDGKLVSQLFVEAEMSVLAPFCEADPTGSRSHKDLTIGTQLAGHGTAIWIHAIRILCA